ncbi:hypothetical protein JHK84_048578 [Glycine max]|nr:hypothetical protein JHK84_048578 [Glycine max]
MSRRHRRNINNSSLTVWLAAHNQVGTPITNPLYPVRYLRPKRRRIKAVIFDRRHSRVLRLLDQKTHGGLKLPSQRCHVEERLRALIPNAPNLRHVSLQTGITSDPSNCSERSRWPMIRPSQRTCHVLVERFGIKEYGFLEGEDLRLSEMMKDKGVVWEEIVKENQLLHTKLEEVGDWWFADAMLGMEAVLDSMKKAKSMGFFWILGTLRNRFRIG